MVNSSVTSFYIGKDAGGVTVPSFGRPYDAGLRHSYDDFAWDATSGVLTVQGTVFIDARDVYISNVKWAGKGTIVCRGNVHIQSGPVAAVRHGRLPRTATWDSASGDVWRSSDARLLRTVLRRSWPGR